ncbi:MAG: hypothetical protein ACI9NC_004578, partial [Verrucomicrobiales bacterium]
DEAQKEAPESPETAFARSVDEPVVLA